MGLPLVQGPLEEGSPGKRVSGAGGRGQALAATAGELRQPSDPLSKQGAVTVPGVREPGAPPMLPPGALPWVVEEVRGQRKTRPILLDLPFVLGPGPVAGPLPAAKPAGHPLRATMTMTDTAVLAQRHPMAASGPCGLSASDQLPGAAGPHLGR